MKQPLTGYRVLVPSVLFGTVRASKGDIVRRELLGCSVRRLIEQGIVEPAALSTPVKQIPVSLM
jgi:hypothetical protein